jgi:ATP-dependent DNA ligase
MIVCTDVRSTFKAPAESGQGADPTGAWVDALTAASLTERFRATNETTLRALKLGRQPQVRLGRLSESCFFPCSRDSIVHTMSDAHFIERMPCLAVKKLPEGGAWQYELKLDGYRALAVKHHGQVTLFSRNRKQFNNRFPAIIGAFARLPDETIIDGEIVAIDESGRPSFSRLQNFSANANAITFYAFDMPMWKGQNLRMQPLDKRRELLRTKVMPKLPAIHFSDSFAANADKMISAVRSQGLEGIVAKRRDSLYEPGRNDAWVKMRIGGGQEFVIGGYTPGPKNFDAVLVGYFERNKLLFAARVRNGFVPTLRTAVSENSKVSKLANARLRICRKVRKDVGVKG